MREGCVWAENFDAGVGGLRGEKCAALCVWVPTHHLSRSEENCGKALIALADCGICQMHADL